MIKLLDTTLRDGGHIIQGDFSKEDFKFVVLGLVAARIDYIEIGWLGPHKPSKFSTFCSTLETLQIELENLSLGNSDLLFMVRPDQTPARSLYLHKTNYLNKVRLAFHYKDLEIMESEIKVWQEHGVQVWLNPIDLPSYTTGQITEIISLANKCQVSCVSIVDTYGVLTQKKLGEIYDLLSSSLKSSVAIGLHSHDNLQMSLALADEILRLSDRQRSHVIDASIYGMGRAPGNLKIELMAPILNQTVGSSYVVKPILEVLENSIFPIFQKKPWGYHPLYAYSGILAIDRTYAEALIENHEFRLDQKVSIMTRLSEMGKESRAFSEEKLQISINQERLVN